MGWRSIVIRILFLILPRIGAALLAIAIGACVLIR